MMLATPSSANQAIPHPFTLQMRLVYATLPYVPILRPVLVDLSALLITVVCQVTDLSEHKVVIILSHGIIATWVVLPKDFTQ
eukprot:6550901-Ditylum_brightwellii.AAC.1